MKLIWVIPVQYLEACVERTPDIYLSELGDALFEGCGVRVALGTIHNALERQGLTRKKVKDLASWH